MTEVVYELSKCKEKDSDLRISGSYMNVTI